eukprot:8416797-Karenia_brevis.AAC.1
MAVESAAYFRQRATALGLADHVDTMVALGWQSMGTFAFAANYVPGSADETSFVAEVVVPILG